jgi:hypothetical protein
MSKEVKTTARKRINKANIVATANQRGFYTDSEKTQLRSLEVKNTIQRVNNRIIGNPELDVTKLYALQVAMEAFNEKVKEILK